MTTTAATGATAARTNMSIEFIVRPKENLYLNGSLRRLPRVNKGDPYPCQMQKSQQFSCLFRHYAKHNGLRKEDLIFTFVDELSPDQTPESSHLMPQDEIWVEHRPISEAEKKEESDVDTFPEQFRTMFENGTHSDVTFLVGAIEEEVRAHKAILSARSDYFKAMFREGAMIESTKKVIHIEPSPHTTLTSFKQMLEFIYTNKVRGLEQCDSDELIALLVIANEYLLQDLRDYAEVFAARVLSVDNIGRFITRTLLSTGNMMSKLRDACANFVLENKVELALDLNFRQEVESSPELGLLLFEYSLPKNSLESSMSTSFDTVDADNNKRRRVSGHSNDDTVSAAPETLHASISNTISNGAAQNNNV